MSKLPRTSKMTVKQSALYTLGAAAAIAFSRPTAALQVMRLTEPRGLSGISLDQHVSSRHPDSLFSRRIATCLDVSMLSEEVYHSDEGSIRSGMPLHDRLRQGTGFLLTALQTVGRTANDISHMAIYGIAVAASGLWIRKTTSIILAIFPAWFRYFLQPFLIAYYVPIFIIRGLTGPTRRQAEANRAAMKERWKDVIEFGKQTENSGYWPVQVTGTFVDLRG